MSTQGDVTINGLSCYQGIMVRPFKEHQGKKYVVVGNRRLKELRKIFADAMATTVQCQNVDDFGGDWREIAMDTNLSLPPHLVERYEMIVTLAKDQKLSEREVCARFGMSEDQYRRVMALGKMSPVVRAAWKAGEITAKVAQLFTLQPDPKEQEKIFEALKKAGRGMDDWEARRRIVPSTQAQNAAQMIAFVGVEAAKKAGALKQEDLFTGENHIVGDQEALNKLVGDKMASACAELVKAGWSWAMPKDKLPENEYNYSDVHPDKKKAVATPEEKVRLTELRRLTSADNDDEDYDFEAGEDEIEAIEQRIASRGFSDEQKKRSGCILRVGHGGELQVTYGKVKPAERQKVAAAERRATGTVAPKKKTKPGEVAITNALAERLSQQFERALAESMPASPYVAVAAMIAGFASYGDVISVDVGKREAKYSSQQANAKNFLQAFEGALKATPEQQVAMLAGIAKDALDLHAFNEEHLPGKKATVQALAAALKKDVVSRSMLAHFDAVDYFGSVDLKTCVEAVRVCGNDAEAARVAKLKKKDAAKVATDLAKKVGYLPPALRTAHYSGPVERAAAKKAPAKKAAKAKK
jgi:ParB family chromosome partitioning protein